jgi:glycosyltransferase involved in cell wall biosynthesis
LVSLAARQPFVIRRDFELRMANEVDKILGSDKIDAIHCDQLWMAQYALRIPRGQERRKRFFTVLDEHNACFQIFQRLARGETNLIKRMILEREWRVLKDYEKDCLKRFDLVVTVTEEDRKTLESLGEQKISGRAGQVIPICVETQPGDSTENLSRVEYTEPVHSLEISNDTTMSYQVIHLGTMFWLPNIEGVMWFSQHVWPQVLKKIPHAKFTIIGKNPPLKIQNLANENSSIHVTGFVRELQPFLDDAVGMVVPLKSGSGMRVKILDAWRWGVPVISTSIGAEGIKIEDGKNILIADSAQEFAKAVIRLMEEPGLRLALRQNGRRWIEDLYDWRKGYELWDTIYRE